MSLQTSIFKFLKFKNYLQLLDWLVLASGMAFCSISISGDVSRWVKSGAVTKIPCELISSILFQLIILFCVPMSHPLMVSIERSRGDRVSSEKLRHRPIFCGVSSISNTGALMIGTSFSRMFFRRGNSSGEMKSAGDSTKISWRFQRWISLMASNFIPSGVLIQRAGIFPVSGSTTMSLTRPRGSEFLLSTQLPRTCFQVVSI